MKTLGFGRALGFSGTGATLAERASKAAAHEEAPVLLPRRVNERNGDAV